MIPPSLEKLVENYPLIKNLEFYNPLLIDPEEESEFLRDLNAKNLLKNYMKNRNQRSAKRK